jgi:hypothetical protein
VAITGYVPAPTPLVAAANAATPLPFRLTVASLVPLIENVTDPVGTPAAPLALRFTVAVNVSLAGGVTGLGDAVNVVVVGASFSVTVVAAEAEPL